MHVLNSLTKTLLFINADAPCQAAVVFDCLLIDHNIHNVCLMRMDTGRPLQRTDMIQADDRLSIMPHMQAGPLTAPRPAVLDLAKINAALAAGVIDPSMPANMQTVLSSDNFRGNLDKVYLEFKDQGTDRVNTSVLRLCLRHEFMPAARQIAELTDQVRQSTGTLEAKAIQESIERNKALIDMPDNSHEIMWKLANSVPLSEQEQAAVDRIDRLIMSDPAIDSSRAQVNEENQKHMARVALLRARMEAAEAARNARTIKK